MGNNKHYYAHSNQVIKDIFKHIILLSYQQINDLNMFEYKNELNYQHTMLVNID